MLKSIFGVLFFNLFLFFGIFQDTKVDVMQNTPSFMSLGEEFEVTVNIVKPNIHGFAKLELTGDEGLEVEVGDMGSASFTFEKGVAKFIWFTLPEESNFQIKYILKNTVEEIGTTKRINGHFSYLVNNEKKVFYLDETFITIQSVESDTLVAIDEVIIPDMTDDSTMMTDEERLLAIQDYTVKIDRNFERLETGEYQMNVAIDKGPIEGFAKLEDVVPDGFDYVENSTSGAIFTKIKGKAKFVWFNLPQDDIVDVSYRLKANESNVIGIHNITGTFTYLIDSRDIKSNTVPAFFRITPDEMVEVIENENLILDGENLDEEVIQGIWSQEHVNFLEEEEQEAVNQENEISENEVVQTEVVENEVVPLNNQVSEIVTKTDEELESDITGIAPVSEGVNYRVQICATRKMAEKDYFRKYKNFNFDIIIDHHENWIKYTTGGYPVYKAAHASRNLITQNYDFDGPFVTAYNNGERITVQEALMITNQKWYK